MSLASLSFDSALSLSAFEEASLLQSSAVSMASAEAVALPWVMGGSADLSEAGAPVALSLRLSRILASRAEESSRSSSSDSLPAAASGVWVLRGLEFLEWKRKK